MNYGYQDAPINVGSPNRSPYHAIDLRTPPTQAAPHPHHEGASGVESPATPLRRHLDFGQMPLDSEASTSSLQEAAEEEQDEEQEEVQEAAADDNTCIEQTCKRAKNGVCLKQLCIRHCVEAGGLPCGCNAHAIASATRAEANAEPATSDQPHTFGPLHLRAGKHAGFTFTSLLTRHPRYCA